MKIMISVSADPEVAKLKKQIQLRAQYEKLRSATVLWSSTKPTKLAKLKAWRKANPDYPTDSLETLQKRLRAMTEKADPKLKVARKGNEITKKQLYDKLAQANRYLDSQEDELHDSQDSDYDYTPVEFDSPAEHKAYLKANIQSGKAEIKKLKAQIAKLK